MRRLALLSLAVVVGSMASACSSDLTGVLSEAGGQSPSASPSCPAATGVVLVLGAHRNAPAPSLDPAIECRLTAAVRGGRPVLLVVASGQPTLIVPALESVTGGSLAGEGARLQDDLGRIRAAMAAARPRSPGVDDLEALSVAADAARSAGAPKAELALLDSGLDDRGALDFTQPGMLGADPADVAAQLEADGTLPDVRGFPVLLVSIGYTSPPQAPLPAPRRDNVTRIWTTLLTSAGAKVDVIPQPVQGSAVRTDQPVLPVPVPTLTPVGPPKPDVPMVFPGGSPVGFEPNTTVFVDPAGAVQALMPIARWLAADPSRQAAVVGTTADVDSMAEQVALSEQRAGRVRDELVALGASRSQISTRGVGSDFPEFTPDRDASGTLLAGPAALNRSVRITLCAGGPAAQSCH